MSGTRVRVRLGPRGGRPVVELGGGTAAERGVLRPRLLGLAPGRARVALVAEGALLLAGDRVAVDVTVGPGARLDLVEPAGTVAYDMRGGSAGWDVCIRVADGARLVWQGMPFVVAEGADVTRRTCLDAEGDASVLLRETLVLGRAGEGPGRLDSRVLVSRGDLPVLVEHLVVGPGKPGVGVLGTNRVLDTVLALGWEGPVCGPDPWAEHYRLASGDSIWRSLGDAAHAVSLAGTWQRLAAG